jgi:hypothetical protein
MQDWMLPHITSYWDDRVDAIERLSRVIDAAPEAERPAQLASITAAVGRHVQGLSDPDIVKFTVPIVEDLYKAASKRTYLDLPLLQYLAASCRPFFRALTARGYVVHYFIDNTYERLDGPAIGFPRWFDAIGLPYICPQEIACHDFEKDKPAEEWPALVTRYIGDGRATAGELVNRCHATGRHFVYLDIDASGNAFEFAFKLSKDPGVIFVFRQEAPVPGSRCTVNLPTEPRTVTAPVAAAAPAPTSVSITTADGRPSDAPLAGGDFKALLGILREGDADKRRFFRAVLKDQIGKILASATAETDLSVVKTILVGIQDAGWQRASSNVEEGFYTVTDAIQAVVDACSRNPLAKALLPVVIDDRVLSVTNSPAAATPNPIPSFAALLKAVKQGQELNKA